MKIKCSDSSYLVAVIIIILITFHMHFYNIKQDLCLELLGYVSKNKKSLQSKNEMNNFK